MRIVCIDQSNDKLFFAFDFLSELNRLEPEIILYIPEDRRNIYGSFFNHFNNIKICLATNAKIEELPHVIFSDHDIVKNAKQYPNSLVYPLITDVEFNAFKQSLDILDSEIRKNIININESDTDSHLFKPVSKWAVDMLFRQTGDKPLQNKSVLISAGPTIEDIDPVRYLTNRSSGKMGIALARAAYMFGADVQLIYGSGSAIPPAYLSIIKVRSASDMYDAIMRHFKKCHVYIGSAAVADFTPTTIKHEKIKKKDGFSELLLQPTKDILKEIATAKKNQLVIGFSVETADTIENSKNKLITKKLDLIVVNNPMEKGAAFDEDTNIVSIIYKDGSIESWPMMTKLDVSNKLMKIIINKTSD